MLCNKLITTRLVKWNIFKACDIAVQEGYENDVEICKITIPASLHSDRTMLTTSPAQVRAN